MNRSNRRGFEGARRVSNLPLLLPRFLLPCLLLALSASRPASADPAPRLGPIHAFLAGSPGAGGNVLHSGGLAALEPIRLSAILCGRAEGFRGVLLQEQGPSSLRDPEEGLPVDPESELLRRGHRDPWMASLASLVLPGAGQFYNSTTAYEFTLDGYRIWMYVQGGAHALTLAMTIFCQVVGTRVELVGGSGSFQVTPRVAQQWRIVHVINAVLASVSAFIEARIINRAGARYVYGMRMHAYYDPGEGALGMEVALRF